jgi:hypothetical protein
MKKPLLLGLDNPHSRDPRWALMPWPRGSAGHRLFCLSGMRWSEYRASFDRANACDVQSPETFSGRTTLVLGKGAWRRIGHPDVEFFSRIFGPEPGTVYVLVPHPSGRNHFYNSSKNRLRVSRLMRRLAR